MNTPHDRVISTLTHSSQSEQALPISLLRLDSLVVSKVFGDNNIYLTADHSSHLGHAKTTCKAIVAVTMESP